MTTNTNTLTNGRYVLPAGARGVMPPDFIIPPRDHASPRDPDFVLAEPHVSTNVEATIAVELLACPRPIVLCDPPENGWREA